ncbi:MAG: hypothetical protein IRY85_11775 [Micromonosporaceae bacterium]|nr:hypothetical protein [Micromonosporaceae bacterium]
MVGRPHDRDHLRVRVAPDGRLANGLVIDASILARLLGLRLLTLDARIRFVPAQFTDAAPLSPPARPPERLNPAPRLAHSGASRGDPWSAHPWAPRDHPPARPAGLDDAADLLTRARRQLDQVRQDLNASLSASLG